MSKADLIKQGAIAPTVHSKSGSATKFTEENKQLALELASKGATNKIIAAALCVNEDTFQAWIRKGRDPDFSSEDWGRSSDEYVEWYQELEKVRANLAAEMSAKVIETAMSGLPNTWQAAMTYLERRYPEEWGRRESRRSDGVAGLPQINVLVLNDADARAAHRDLLRSVAGAGSGKSLGPGVGGQLEGASGDEAAVVDVE